MKPLRYSLALAFCTLLGACSVQPYERQKLADPIMSFDRDPVSSSYLGHVHDAREAGRGADGSAGGGCGCN